MNETILSESFFAEKRQKKPCFSCFFENMLAFFRYDVIIKKID